MNEYLMISVEVFAISYSNSIVFVVVVLIRKRITNLLFMLCMKVDSFFVFFLFFFLPSSSSWVYNVHYIVCMQRCRQIYKYIYRAEQNRNLRCISNRTLRLQSIRAVEMELDLTVKSMNKRREEREAPPVTKQKRKRHGI